MITRVITVPGGNEIEVDRRTFETAEGVFLHQNRAEMRTIERWRDKVAHAAFRDTWAAEAQELENALWGIYFSLLLDDAFGASLDRLGVIVGEPRAGRADPEFRVRIKARVLINMSKGRAPDILALLALLEVVDAPRLTDLGPASFLLELMAPPPALAASAELPGLISETRAAGVGGMLIMPTSEVGFTFSDVGDTDDPTLGFSDLVAPDPDVGGTLADMRNT